MTSKEGSARRSRAKAREPAATPVTPQLQLDVTEVWQQVTPALAEELVAFWLQHDAMRDRARAAQRASQAVAIARDADGHISAVGTVVLRILPRLRQPTYYYRTFIAPDARGQRQTKPLYRYCFDVLQRYNRTLPRPESLGVLCEIESQLLASHYRRVRVPEAADAVFIGYSPKGLSLYLSYFQDAVLGPPAPLAVRAAPARGRPD